MNRVEAGRLIRRAARHPRGLRLLRAAVQFERSDIEVLRVAYWNNRVYISNSPFRGAIREILEVNCAP